MFLLSFVSPSQPFWVSFLLLTLSLPLMPADTACCFLRPSPQSSAPCACTPAFFQHTLEGACRQWGHGGPASGGPRGLPGLPVVYGVQQRLLTPSCPPSLCACRILMFPGEQINGKNAR